MPPISTDISAPKQHECDRGQELRETDHAEVEGIAREVVQLPSVWSSARQNFPPQASSV